MGRQGSIFSTDRDFAGYPPFAHGETTYSFPLLGAVPPVRLIDGGAWLFIDWHIAKPLILAGVLAAVAFGLCHWLNWEYALVAGIIGLYFGWLFLITKNLLAPMVAHAAYDFIALCFLVRYKK